MKKGFTLIELLVVVLIIGILSAVALPQYKKAVWRSRATQLQTMTRALSTAQTAYFAANGTGTDSFDDLDLSFPLPVTVDPANYGAGFLAYTDARATSDLKYGCVLNNRSDGGVATGCFFLEGDYAGGGFYALQNSVYSQTAKVDKLYCANNEEFCKNVMNYKVVSQVEFWDVYSE